MKALILAAGLGNRLGKRAEGLPKALVKVAGQELIRHQLAWLDHPAITKIGVVGGYQFPNLAAFLSQQAPKVRAFENREFKEGNILSLKAACSFLDDDFLLMNVDHIYPKPLLDHLLKNCQGISAACDFDRKLTADDMKVSLNTQGYLKAIDKNLANYQAGYIGMTFCSKSLFHQYQAGIASTLEKLGRKACVEKILGELAHHGTSIPIIDTSGFHWLEIDTAEDLNHAERTLS